jgi:DNA topoisomerase-3
MTTILSVAEKPSVARELTRIIAGVAHENLRRQGFSHSNPVFDIEQCKFQNKPAKMKMTSVLGHLMELEFDPAYKGWSSCLPIELFTAPLLKDVKPDNLNIKKTLVQEAKKCNVLLLWLDCDLEVCYHLLSSPTIT